MYHWYVLKGGAIPREHDFAPFTVPNAPPPAHTTLRFYVSTFSPLFLTDLGASGALLASGTTLSEGSSHDSGQFVSIFWITLVALLSPILSRVTGKKIPDVVFLLIFGLLIGPNMLNLASSEGGIPLLKELGLGIALFDCGL